MYIVTNNDGVFFGVFDNAYDAKAHRDQMADYYHAPFHVINPLINVGLYMGNTFPPLFEA